MIKIFRQKSVQKRIFLGLAIFIIPSFVISGLLLGHENQKTSGSLGVIGSQNISFQKYLSSYQATMRQLSLIYGAEASKISQRMNIKGEAWDRLLLLDYAKSSHIKASDSDVVSWIAEQPAFNSKSGFDDRFYKQFVTEHLRMTPRAFEEEMRDTLTIQKIREKLKAKVQISDDELKNLYNQEHGRKELLAGFVPSESVIAGITPPKDEELQQLFPMVQQEFKEPQRIKALFIFIPSDQLDGLKAALEEKDSPLETLAKKYSLQTIETGFFSANDAVPEIGPIKEVLEAAFQTEKGKETDWIHVAKGAYKLKITEIQEARVLDFEHAKDSLREIYMAQLASQAAGAKLDKLADELKSGDFEKVLKDQGIEVKTPEAFGFGPRALEAAKTLKPGAISPSFSVPSGAAVVKVLKALPADEKKFEEERKNFKEEMFGKKTNEEFKSLLESLRKTRLKVNLESMRKLFPQEQNPVSSSQ